MSVGCGTIPELVSREGKFIREAAEHERSEIFNQSGYTEEGLLKNEDEAKKRFGIAEINAHPSTADESVNTERKKSVRNSVSAVF